MTTPDDTTQPASGLSSPLPETASIPLSSPSSVPLAAPTPGRRHRAFDGFLVIVVLAFAFLAASFAVRNSDFWMHLAGGRLLAEGRYQFGVDPFAYTTRDVYWANRAWLFDLLLFLLYQSLGGTVLVVLKALLIVVLAALMLSVRRPGSGLGVPAVCTLLAVLAMSPRLLLHSTCLSYVFLGLAFWLLWRSHAGPSTPRQDVKRYAPLLLLFVLWVNVDGWFLLGPLLAALFWLGDRLRPARSDGDGTRRTPAWLWLAGLAVCLVNPHTWHAFTLPVDLTPLPDELRHDPRFERLLASPWHLNFLYHPVAGLNLATSAYFALLALGLLSFLLNSRHLVGWRLLVWCSFAGLSAWLARAIPFFAVVAAPITVLNLQEAISTKDEVPSTKSRFVLGTSYFVLMGSCLALLALAWIGWLGGFHSAGAASIGACSPIAPCSAWPRRFISGTRKASCATATAASPVIPASSTIAPGSVPRSGVFSTIASPCSAPWPASTRRSTGR